MHTSELEGLKQQIAMTEAELPASEEDARADRPLIA